jgi:hypothetical protein
MRFKVLALTAALLSASQASPAFAHHSNAMFDRTKTIEVKGVVREFQWTNPHVWIELDIPGANGAAATPYSIEGPAPGVLRPLGWKFNTLKPGDSVAVRVHPLKTGKPGGGMVSVTTAAGVVMNYEPPPAVGAK